MRVSFKDIFKRIREGSLNLNEPHRSNDNFLELKIEIVNRLIEPCRLCERRCMINRKSGRRGRSKVRHFIKRPLPVVKANKKVIDIMRMFASGQISLIAVLYKGKIMGYITTREMIRILPEIIDSMITTTKFERKPLFKTKVSLMGYCDRCGVWSDRLVEVDGNFYCPDCIADLFGESI